MGGREAEITQRRRRKTASLLKALIDATCVCLPRTLQANGEGEVKREEEGKGKMEVGGWSIDLLPYFNPKKLKKKSTKNKE